MSVSIVNGWTEITPPAGAKTIYVSTSSGSDSNNGSSPSSPVMSFARAKKLMRSGAGDQLLLKRGDTFRESFGYWDISGKDASNPTLIGAYGSGNRPLVATGSKNGFNTAFAGVHDVAIIGLNFSAAGRGSAVPDGIISTGKVTNFLIEDTKVEGYRNNIDFESFLGPSYNLKVRRSVVVDAWSRGSHSQGIYADGVHGVLLEGNVFDHNGWGNGAGQTMFNHNAYITAKSSGLTAIDNIFANASSHGLQARPGGTVTGNAFINNGVGLSYGLVNGSGVVTPGGVTGIVANNIFYGGHNIGAAPAGVGIETSNIKSATITDNLFQIGVTTTPNPAIAVSNINGTTNRASAVGIQSLNITNNTVYGWNQGIAVGGGFTIKNLQIRGNDFQNIKHFQVVTNYGLMSGQSWSGNRYNVPRNKTGPVIVGNKYLTIDNWSRSYDSGAQDVAVAYPDKNRSVNSYAGDYLARARNLSKAGWDTRYTSAPLISYLKGGFRGSSTVTPPVVTPPTSPSPIPTPTPVPPTTGSTSPAVTVNDVSATEGRSGVKNLTFTVSLTKAAAKQVSIKWETKGATAVVGKDYVGGNGTLYFAAGQTSKTITVQIKGDTLRESSETFSLNLLSVVNATLADNKGLATIVNDD
ncbi:Calx-beta domain-containing protein [Humisphaera borealis]|uniref:Calx-beta domain-containing protein n=1 Tax=Humisphaera borealis TaxID=2807512 RepID=A0A7M2WUJ6_9BACT|nr:Calx-beta domain-containing protein [Humisphaera borealis]QOV89119.1 hypothetical protein IPV69_23335 [Humisphaera borealis]